MPAPDRAAADFSLPAQPLDKALAEFARQAGLQLMAAPDLVQGRQGRDVRGRQPVPAALEELLRGSGLRGRVDGSTLIIERTPAVVETSTLGTITVRAAAETATGPVSGYVARRSATAGKTDTPLLETPQAVTVIGREQLDVQGARSLIDAVRYAPGVAAGNDPVENRFASLRICGFAPTLYVDGMERPSGASQFGRPMVDTAIVERIEVLRGPSSSLYGQVPPGGMVNFVSLMPPEDPTRTVQVGVDGHGRRQLGVDLGGPIDDEGRLSYRLTAQGYEGGMQIDRVDERRNLIAPSFTFRPDAKTTLTLQGLYQQDASGTKIQFLPASGTLRPNPYGRIPYGTFVGEPGQDSYRRRQQWWGYAFEHRFDDTWTFRQKLRYTKLDTDLLSAIGAGLRNDMRTLNRQSFSIAENAESATIDNQLEARFATGALTHTLLAGLDARRASTDNTSAFGSASPIDVFAPARVSASTMQSQTQTGFYLQDQMALGPWRLTLSGRHDKVDSRLTNRITNSVREQDDAADSGRIGLNYLFDSGLAPYVAWSKSFQPTLGVGFDGEAFKPTRGEQVEAGIKYQPAGSKLSINAAVFDLKQRNATTADPQHPTFSIQTGGVRSRGFEFDATAELARGLNLIATYSYTDASVTASNGPDLGKQVITVPRHQAGLWMDYILCRRCDGRLDRGRRRALFRRDLGRLRQHAAHSSATRWSMPCCAMTSAVSARACAARSSRSTSATCSTSTTSPPAPAPRAANWARVARCRPACATAGDADVHRSGNRWQAVGPPAFRRGYAVHRWTSLICTLFLLILCLTGLPLILKEEIGVWSGSTVEPPPMPAGTLRIGLDRIVADAQAKRPQDAIRYISQSDDSPAWFVTLGATPDSANATAVYKYDARTGALLRDIEQRSGFMYVVRALHVELLSGLRGTLFLGAMGLAFVLSIVSGVVIYGPYMRKLRFGSVRRQRTRRLYWLDVHNLTGIVAALWMLVVGVTGVVNTLATPMLLYWQRTEVLSMTAAWRGEPPVRKADMVQRAADTALAAAPGMDISFIGFPGSRFSSPHHYMVFMRGNTPLTERLLRAVMVDAETGGLTATRSLPWYLSALLLSQPLHFGDYGGLPLQIIWIALDLVTIFVLGSGVYLWRKRAAPP